MIRMEDVVARPVNQSTWKDFESLFESRGGPHHCWCMVWRPKEKNSGKEWKKNYMQQLIEGNQPVGLLAYAGNVPIAWCSVAPRNTYRNLGGVEKENEVWSLVCFFIKKEFRGRGLIRYLVEQAKVYAKENGASFLEAYPVLPSSHSYRFMGFIQVFEKAGFNYMKKAGTKRHVMIIDL